MNRPQMIEGGAGPEIFALHQRDRQATRRRIASDDQAVDAAANAGDVAGSSAEPIEVARHRLEVSEVPVIVTVCDIVLRWPRRRTFARIGIRTSTTSKSPGTRSVRVGFSTTSTSIILKNCTTCFGSWTLTATAAEWFSKAAAAQPSTLPGSRRAER